jgi:hypothetical protein
MLLLLASPLAFSTALLPNTENIFRKWGNNFLRLLVIYPAFMFIWAICRGLQAAFLSPSGVGALELILAMLLSVAPVAVILPLFKGTGGLTGKVANIIQRGSAGFSPGNITNNQTTNNKVNSQNIDQINQKKFSTDKSIKTTNTANSRDGGVQNTFSDESNSVLNSRTTQAASEIGVVAGSKAAGGKSKRSRALSANLKTQVDVANAQKSISSTLSSINNSSVSNASNASNSSNLSNAISSRMNNASNIDQSKSSQNNSSLENRVQNATTNNSAGRSKIDLNGEFDKLSDVLKVKGQSQSLTRERASAATKAAPPTPTVLSRQSFVEGSSDDKKAQKTFDVATKNPTTNIFSGDGQQVSIENSGETSQLVEQKILDGPAMVDGAPSIVPDGDVEQISEPEASDADITGQETNQLTEEIRTSNQAGTDEATASAPSIVPADIITDDDRKNRFAGESGQKELAKMLTVDNIKQLLPSDIDYVLGLGPLLGTDGEELSPAGDISKEPEYASATQAITNYIGGLNDDEKNGANILKWQKQLDLL